MQTLSEITPEICIAATEAIDFAASSGSLLSCNFSYDDENWSISGTVQVGGHWHSEGDGYETPVEDILTDGFGSLADLTVDCYHEETDDRILVSCADYNALWAELDSHISDFMSTYQP